MNSNSNHPKPFELSMSDAQMAAKNAFEEIHYGRYRAFDAWNVPEYCKYLSEDIIFTVESPTSDNINVSGIEAVTNMTNGFRDVLNNEMFDGFCHETKAIKYNKIDPNRVEAEIALSLWQRIKATGEWKQQVFNKLIDKEPKLGRFTLFVTSEKRDGKWVVTEQKSISQD